MRATHNVVVYMSDRSVSRRPHSFESSSSRAAQQAASAHAHFCRHDGARSGPRETARCVAFAFIDLRPLAAVLQIHLLLLLSHTYEIRVDIRDEIRNGAKFLPEGFIQVETVVPCFVLSRISKLSWFLSLYCYVIRNRLENEYLLNGRIPILTFFVS